VNLKLILHNAGYGKKEFDVKEGARSWGILLLISAGSYTLTFPRTGESFTLLPYEISYIPPDTPFFRHVEDPIDFHQFVFQAKQEHPFLESLHPGRLAIPPSQAASILQNLSLSLKLPQHSELILAELEHIIRVNYLFSRQDATDSLSEDIRAVVSYMENHLAERINLDHLAAQAYLSTTGLIWKFHRQLGTTPQQYLILLRMRLAKQLLLEEALSISHIAERCGYANAYYFSNAFRKSSGMSPTEFRSLHFRRSESGS